MEAWWWIPLAAFGFFAVVLVLNGIVTLFGGRWLRGWLKLVIGLGLSWASLGLALLGLNLQTYAVVADDTPLATVSFNRVEPGVFDATLTQPGRQGMIDDIRVYRLSADQWHLSARSLTWHPAARPLGLASRARLETLSGLIKDRSTGGYARASAHQLHDGEPMLEAGGLVLPWKPTVWATTHKLGSRIGLLTPRLVETPPMEMQNGAVYEINLEGSGLIIRPVGTARMDARPAGEVRSIDPAGQVSAARP